MKKIKILIIPIVIIVIIGVFFLLDRRNDTVRDTDFVVKDNVFSNIVTDIYQNFPSYENKTIKISGTVRSDNDEFFLSRTCGDCGEIYYIKIKNTTNINIGDWVTIKGIVKQDKNNDYYIDVYYTKKHIIKGNDIVEEASNRMHETAKLFETA